MGVAKFRTSHLVRVIPLQESKQTSRGFPGGNESGMESGFAESSLPRLNGSIARTSLSGSIARGFPDGNESAMESGVAESSLPMLNGSIARTNLSGKALFRKVKILELIARSSLGAVNLGKGNRSALFYLGRPTNGR